MPCYHSQKGWRSKNVNPSGKRSITHNREEALIDMPVEYKCGQCIGCRIDRSQEWAVRVMHEASQHEHNSFITLTYDNEHLPGHESLLVEDFQKFMKTLRSRVHRDQYRKPENRRYLHDPSDPVRYYHCGEYGDSFSRPHYHACLFNCDFRDRSYLKTVKENPYYISEELSSVWKKGHILIGDVTFASAAYVARYIMKKVTGQKRWEHYGDVLDEHGIYIPRPPEYTTMSQSIGKKWFDEYKFDVFPHDFVVVDGKKVRTPHYYKKLLEKEYPKLWAQIRANGIVKSKKHEKDNTVERLRVREELQYEKASRLVRSMHNETDSYGHI